VTKRLKVLFLCVSNSCRSQMAEGWARALGAGVLEPFSAGQKATWVQPNAVRVMGERGVDIRSQWSKTVDKVPVNELDYIVTLCAEGAEFCPSVPGPAQRLHWGIDDPVSVKGDDEAVIAAYRRARDEIEARVKSFVRELQGVPR
jgi:arsenate reductase